MTYSDLFRTAAAAALSLAMAAVPAVAKNGNPKVKPAVAKPTSAGPKAKAPKAQTPKAAKAQAPKANAKAQAPKAAGAATTKSNTKSASTKGSSTQGGQERRRHAGGEPPGLRGAVAAAEQGPAEAGREREPP